MMEKKFLEALYSGGQTVPQFLRWVAERLTSFADGHRVSTRTMDELLALADKMEGLKLELDAAGPPVMVKLCATAMNSDDEEELSAFIRFRGDKDLHAFSFYGRRVDDLGASYHPMSTLTLEEIRQFALNTRHWAEQHGFGFEMDEMLGSMLEPLEEEAL